MKRIRKKVKLFFQKETLFKKKKMTNIFFFLAKNMIEEFKKDSKGH